MHIISLSQVTLYAWADNTPARTKDCLKKNKVNRLMWEENFLDKKLQAIKGC